METNGVLAMLTDEQINFFNEFGFLVFRQLFSLEEMETIGSEAEVALNEVYQGREGGPQGSWVPLLGPSTPFNASLLEDKRFYSIATQLFDESIIGLNTDMLWWQANTKWHRDLDVPGNTGLKFIYYLDALQAENGSLRVVPGSHIEPHHTNIPEIEPLRLTPKDEDYMQKVRVLKIQPGECMLPSVAVESEPGDVIAFAMPLLHASFGGAPNRRFGATVYWAPSKTPEQADARRKEARTIHSNHYRMFNYPIDAPFCHPHWIEGAQGNPVRERWIECLRDLAWISAL